MKKLLVLFTLTLLLAGIFSSCSEKTCPAYSSLEEPTTEINA